MCLAFSTVALVVIAELRNISYLCSDFLPCIEAWKSPRLQRKKYFREQIFEPKLDKNYI